MAAAAVPLIQAAIPVIGSLFGGLFGGSTQKKAGEALANVQYGAANDIINAMQQGQAGVTQAGQNVSDILGGALQRQVQGATGAMNTISGAYSPFLQQGQAGVNALGQFATAPTQFSYADYANDPAFKFQLEQGQQAIGNAAAAQGMAAGGNVLKELQKYGTGLAASNYQDAFNRYMSSQQNQLQKLQALTGAGLTAAGGMSQGALGTANLAQNAEQWAGGLGSQNQMDVAKFLAGLGMTGNEMAANYRIGGEQARQAGRLGQMNTVLGMSNQLQQSVPGLVSGIWNAIK